MDSKQLLILIIALFSIDNIVLGENYNLLFNHLTVNDGLSQNNIMVIIEDRDGIMWFGTNKGLNKFDGYDFTVYTASDEPGALVSDNIVELFEDSYGTFWIGTDASGLSLFDREKDVFHNFVHVEGDPTSISNNRIRAVFEDSERNVWIGTAGGGLCLFNRADSTFTTINHQPGKDNTLGSDFIGSISEDLDGNLWIGTTTGELVKFNKKDSLFTNFKVYESVTGDVLSPINGRTLVDSDGDVWYLSTEGVSVYSKKTKSFKYIREGNSEYDLNFNTATAILEYKKGLFFILVDHGGINIYDKKSGKISCHQSQKFDNVSINSNQVQAVYRSKDGIVWIGTYNNGLNLLRDKDRFFYYGDLLQLKDKLSCCNSTLSMCNDPDGNIWLGYDGEGIDVWNPETHVIKRHITTNDKNTIKSDIVSSLYCDNYGNILIGYFLDGMSVYNWKTKTFKYFKQDTNEENNQYLNNIWSVLQDSKDKYWLGTHYGGLKLFDMKNNRYNLYNANYDTTYKEGYISDDYISNLFKDSKGDLWIGTIDGLNRFCKENNDFITYTERDSGANHIVGAWVQDIYESSNGNLWVGTEKALNLFRPETDDFICFDTDDGIEGADIRTILEDKSGNLWFSTDRGITRCDCKNNKFRNFDVSDYLQGKEFVKDVGVIGADGNFYFGSQNGFVSFSPDKFELDTNKYPIFITDIKIVNKSKESDDNMLELDKRAEFKDTITLTYQQNELSFKFAYLSYYMPEKNIYKYMLEGYDTDWISNGTKRDAKYTNLDPGQYVFRVMGANFDGVWNDSDTSVVINIVPPFWKTIWFKVLEILILILFVILIIHIRNRRLHREKRRLQAMVEERTEELREQAEELKEMNVLVEESKEEVVLQNEKLIQHKNNLEKIVYERTQELLKAKEKAEESDRLKSSFLANMSHEIRTPLNAIVGFSRIITETSTTEEERIGYSSIISDSSDSLLMLVNDILDFSSIEANQLVINKTVFYINELFDNLYSSFLLSRKNKDVNIVLNCSDKSVKVYTDKLRLRQILVNLLQNAFKFTKEGFVELGYYIESDSMVMYVKDTGSGISKTEQKHIFDRFRKSNKQNDKVFRGIGLGLTISKRLGELLDGNLTVESKTGNGSIFYLSIPVDKIIQQE